MLPIGYCYKVRRYYHIITKTKQQPGTSVANQVSFVTDRIIKTSKITFNSFVSVHDISSLLHPACLDQIPRCFAPSWQLNAPCANRFRFQDGGLKLPLAHEVSLRTMLRRLLRSLHWCCVLPKLGNLKHANFGASKSPK